MASPPPFQVEGIDHLLLAVDDMAAALAFYGDVLGCPTIATLPQHAMAQLQAGTSLIDLVDISSPAGAWARTPHRGANMEHLCLALSAHSTDALRAHLASHGV